MEWIGRLVMELGAGIIPVIGLFFLMMNWNVGSGGAASPPVITIRIVK